MIAEKQHLFGFRTLKLKSHTLKFDYDEDMGFVFSENEKSPFSIVPDIENIIIEKVLKKTPQKNEAHIGI